MNFRYPLIRVFLNKYKNFHRKLP